MTITSLDIRRKEFKRAVRGYADEEVDFFLDEIADEFERMAKETAVLQERLARVEEQLVGHRQIRDALEKTLVTAQLQADETRAAARRDYDTVMHEAEQKAQSVMSDSYGQVQRMQGALVHLKYLEEEFRSKFQSLLEGHLRLLAEAPLSATAEHVMAESAPLAESRGTNPFEIPSELGSIPEFPAVAAAATSAVPAAQPVIDVPAAIVPPTPRTDASASWDETADSTAADDTAAGDQSSEMARFGISDAQIRAIGDPEPSLEPDFDLSSTDETSTREEDPLRNFFFGNAKDRTVEEFLGEGKDGTGKVRDFEW